MDFNLKKLSNSPLGAAIKLVLAIIVGEFAIMVAIGGVFTPLFGKEIRPIFWEFLDPVLLSAIVVPVIYVLVLRPMSEQQIRLEQQKEELGIAAITFNAQDGVIVTDANYTILKVNRSFSSITGYSSEEAVGKTPALLQSGRQDKEFYRLMRKSLETNKFWQGEIWNRRKNGEIYPEWLTITEVMGEIGNKHYVGIFSDITKRKLYEDKINFMAYHDKLTELPSRELFYDCLSRAISQVRRKRDHLALLYLDLDGFKAVNDTFGHEAGDEVLKITSQRLLSSVRDVDTVARLGGDEFAIILSEIENSEDATSVAKKIISNLSEPMMLNGGHECWIGVSIGISLSPENGTEIDRLMSAADSAMYESKAGGKNIYTLTRDQTYRTLDDQNWIVLDKNYLFGVPELDQEHLELAALLNKLNVAVIKGDSLEITAKMLDKFSAEIRTHFQNEDRLMDQYGYPDNDVHKNEHQRLINEMNYLEDKFKNGGEMVTLHNLKQWLLSHILNSDKQFGDFILHQRAK